MVIKKVLDKAGIKSYPKTSGISGIHIYIPTGGKYSYKQVRDFAKIIAMITNQILPNTTSIERSPNKRDKKVYLDYMQNNRGQTIVAPYSLRPVKGAVVSTPLKWKEVDKNLDPAKFNIKTILGRIKSTGDIFKDVLGSGEDLKSGLEKLQK